MTARGSLSADTPSATFIPSEPSDGHRLEREGPAGPADQDIGAATDADVDVAGYAHIFTGKRPRGRTPGRREHGPRHYAAGGEADVQPDRVDRPVIGLGADPEHSG
jgi:hypothetical protein